MTHTKPKSETAHQDAPSHNSKMLKAVAVLAAACACFSAGTSRLQAQDKLIYFLPGPHDHPAGVGRHETERDMQVLQDCIDHVTNVKGVKITTKYLASRTNVDVEDLKGVAAVIVECSAVDSSPRRTHPLFPPLPQGQREYDEATVSYLKQLDELHKAGMGVMILHWGIAVNAGRYPQVRDYYQSWFGQNARNNTQNPTGLLESDPHREAGKNHPIMRGVGPWVYEDEIFSRLAVTEGDPHRTDLLMGESPQTNQSEGGGSPQGVISPRLIAAAYENGKERGILWGGMDFHSALLNENYLRFVMNEIIWVAGIDVPEGGVKTSATKLNLVPPSHAFSQYKKPEGYVEPKMPDAQ